MKYALFLTQDDADRYAEEMQTACDQAHVEGTPRIIKSSVYIQWMGKWAVAMEHELPTTGEVVDTIEPPKIDIGME